MLAALLAVDFDVTCAVSAEEAQSLLGGRPVDIVVADQFLPGQSGVQLLEWVRLHQPRTIRILMTGVARIEDAIDAINTGQVHRYLFKPWRPEHLMQILRGAARNFLLERSHEQLLEELRKLNLELEQRVHQRTSELQEANRQLEQKNSMLHKMALTDELTGLPNRRAMDRLARGELMRRTRYPAPLALGLIDADHFKEINSRYLLSGGDHALIWLAQTLARSVRTTDHVGRIGGEEFMVVAPETDAVGAMTLADRIRDAVARGRTVYNEQTIGLTVSIGVAVVDPGVPTSYDQMKLVASDALQQAKLGGRNRSVVYTVPGAESKAE
jgi:diguanylate cyclase (GGDEF)-like protein